MEENASKKAKRGAAPSFATPCRVVLGLQWGDEGKGKLVDILSNNMDVVARCAGGNNAGHTVVVSGDDGKEYKYDFHLLPSGVTHQGCTSVIGNGVVVNIPDLFAEIEHNIEQGPHIEGWQSRLKISNRAHIVLNIHKIVDGMKEDQRGNDKIGTTKKGIGPTYSSKATRNGIRMCDLLNDFSAFEEKVKALYRQYKKLFPSVTATAEEEIEVHRGIVEKLRPLVCDTFHTMQSALEKNRNILVEGANATMLDLDFGTYPYVTSSSCSIGGVLTGLGLPPHSIGEIYGVVKAYTTRVGDGEFPTEAHGDVGDTLQKVGHEFGTTTGRARRCGWLDMVVVRYSCRINGVASICLTKLDVLDGLDEIKIGVSYKHNETTYEYNMPPSQQEMGKCVVDYITMPGWKTSIEAVRKFEDLPENAQKYVKKIEELCGVPVRWIGVGPNRDATIQCF
eukprot:m.64720 g.64720  ORF g.64720 m.64720 type:complete len:450 (+) comp11502_c4_seq1:62-1411(+)